MGVSCRRRRRYATITLRPKPSWLPNPTSLLSVPLSSLRKSRSRHVFQLGSSNLKRSPGLGREGGDKEVSGR